MKKPIAPFELRQFVKVRTQPEAVLNRIGHGTWDLVVIDADGNWERGVFASDAEAQAACAELGISVTKGWDARLSRRMNALDSWTTPGSKRRAL